MSQRYVYIFCVLLNYPMTVWRKEKITSEPTSGEMGRFREKHPHTRLCFSENFWKSLDCGFDVVVKAVEGEEHLWHLFFFVPVPQGFFNLLTFICTYKQCLQKNTFTGVDWLVHNYPYLKCHGTLTVKSQVNNDSDPSCWSLARIRWDLIIVS